MDEPTYTSAGASTWPPLQCTNCGCLVAFEGVDDHNSHHQLVTDKIAELVEACQKISQLLGPELNH